MSHVVSAEIVANVLCVPVEAGQRVGATRAGIVSESAKVENPVLEGVAGAVTGAVVAQRDGDREDEPLAVLVGAR